MDHNILPKSKSFSHQIGKGVTQATLNVAQTAGKPWFGRELETTLGQEYAKPGEFTVAMEQHHKNALSVAEMHGNNEEISREYRFLENSFYKIKDYGMAITCYSQFLTIAPQNDTEEAWANKILGLS